MIVARLLYALSVRTRIALLALIPVAGFLANGAAYLAGEAEVGRAFESMKQAGGLADASRAFNGAVGAMGNAARDFVTLAPRDQVAKFQAANALALEKLEAIAARTEGTVAKDLDRLERTVRRLQSNFEELVAEHQQLGFTATEGLLGRLRETAEAAEHMVEKASWLLPVDSQQLAMSLAQMRRHEMTYVARRDADSRDAFGLEFDKFNDIVDSTIGEAARKAELKQALAGYRGAFRDWAQISDSIAGRLTGIESDTQLLTRVGDDIVTSAYRRQEDATAAVASSQSRTAVVIVLVGCVAVLIGLILSWWIGRTITQPLSRLAGAMGRLAEGDTSVAIPATDARDEIGRMARTVIVFRDNAVERERLAANEARAHRAREARGETITTTIARFERSVDQALAKVRGAAQRLDDAATALNGAADAVSAEARDAEERVAAASENVSSAAASTEEFKRSWIDIAASYEMLATSADKIERETGSNRI